MRMKRSVMAMLMAITMVVSSLVPSMGAVAAEPNNVSTTTNEMRTLLTIFYSEEYYIRNNPDVFAAFGNNSILLRQHWEEYGIPEGRQYLSPILDVRAYRVANVDLERAFGDDWIKYFLHYKNYGAKEIALGQRSPKGQIFDPVEYLDAHPELSRDIGVAMAHYISNGMPIGNWVNARYTAGPAVALQSSLARTDNSSSHASNDAGYGGSGNSGGNGGGLNKPNPTPDKPGPTNPPVGPDGPNEPDEPVQPTHSKESTHVKEDFGDDGECTQGCGLTLTEFQQMCKMDHSVIEVGHFCVVCGAEGSYDPTEEHTKDSLHTKNSFDENGDCMHGCGLTLAEFQAACTENHELHVGQSCPNCNYQGMIPYDKEACPNAVNHNYGEECNFCNYAGECMEDHGEIYTTKTCEVCGEHGTKECKVDHGEIFKGVFCKECGAEGTKPEPEACENEANHNALHKGQNCPGCGIEGEANHVWDAATGECTGCDAKCSNLSGHVDILQGDTCEICGYEGMKEPITDEHPEGYAHSLADFVGGKCGICGMTVDDFQKDCASEEHETLKATGGTCSVCGKEIAKVEFVCPKGAEHENLHKGVACDGEGCDYVGEADHTFVDGTCECGEKDPNYKAPCTEADHAALACGEECPNCDYVAPAHAYENGVCTRCNNACPNDHADVACGEQCGICMWVAPGHAYANSETAGYCARCGQECTHAFSNGTCGHCGISDPDYCGNRFHDFCYSEGTCPDCGKATKPDHVFAEGSATCNDCDAPNPNYVKPAEHVHVWNDGVCSGEGECTGCPDAGGHGDIPTTGTCGTCGAAGTKPVYAHVPDDGHEHNFVGDYCTECGAAKVGFGESEEEISLTEGNDTSGEPASSGDGSLAAGGDSSGENGTDESSTGEQGLPDALPVETVIVTEYKNDTEPEPEGGEDDTEGGGTPADKEEEGEEGEAEEGNGENPEENSGTSES